MATYQQLQIEANKIIWGTHFYRYSESSYFANEIQMHKQGMEDNLLETHRFMNRTERSYILSGEFPGKKIFIILLFLLTNLTAWVKFLLTVPVTPSILQNDADQNGSFFCSNPRSIPFLAKIKKISRLFWRFYGL